VGERGDLEERVVRLEGEIAALRSDLRRAELRRAARESGLEGELEDADRQGIVETGPVRETEAAPAEIVEDGRGARRSSPLGFDLRNLADARSGEWWLSRVGIGLLLLGVVFSFAYSVERGWIGPPVRVGVGVALGLALVAAGLSVRRRPFLSGALLGGGVGTLYASVFAAYGLYALLPHAAAFAAMVAVTVLSFFLSLRRDDVTPALVGTVGGLGTPFLLYSGDGSFSGLVLYTCLILAGAAAVYLYKGWVPLAFVAFVGGWAVLGSGFILGVGSENPSPGDRWALQAGIVTVWLLFAVAPVARVLMLGRNAAPAFLVPTLAVLSPLVALASTGLFWPWSTPRELGWIALSAASLYALAALAFHYGRALRDENRPPSRVVGRSLVRTHALVALLLLNVSAFLILRGDALLLVLAAEAAVLAFASRRLSDGMLSGAAHLLSAIVAAWVLGRLLIGFLTGAPPEPSAAADLAALAVLCAASFAFEDAEARRAYRVGVHLGLLAWLWRVLAPTLGDASVTVSWGLHAAGLLVAGLLLNSNWRLLVRLGATTLPLVVGKLFLVDLASVGLGTRVLLFLGLGALFLALGYYLGAFRKDTTPSLGGEASGADETRAEGRKERVP
jgi:uncharacterized membrane protein